MTRFKTLLVTACLVLAGLTAAFVVQYQANEALQRENDSLRRELAQLQSKNQALSNSLAQEKTAPALPSADLDELLKLRNEVGLLREQTNLLAKARRQEAAPQTPADSAAPGAASEEDDAQDELQGPEALSKFNDAKIYCLGLMMYAMKHAKSFPTNLDQTQPYLRLANRAPSGTNQFDILYQGSLSDLTNPAVVGRTIVLRSQPWLGKDGKWVRIYGFADGHCEAHTAADGDFTAWESQHLPAGATGQR